MSRRGEAPGAAVGVTARLQRLVVAAIAVAAAVWVWHFARVGSPAWALAGLLAIGCGHGVLLAVEFALAAWLNRHDASTPQAGLRAWFAACWHEWWLATRVFGWEQPFRSRAVADHLPAVCPPASGGDGARQGVLLVHGYLCNRGLWNPWLARLRQRDLPFIAVDLEPVFASIDDYTAAIDAAVQRLFAATGRPVLIVAHSMGGLVVRAWLDAMGEQADPLARVRHVFTIGSPHRGTWLARFGRSHSARQMRLGGAWHGGLAGRETAERFRRFTCFYSRCDNVVAPATSATLPGADNRHLAGSGHVALLYRAEVFDAVQRFIDMPTCTAAAVSRP